MLKQIMELTAQKIPIKVFLDSNVIVKFLRGELENLFDNKALKIVQYVINPVVFQEVVLYNANHKTKHDISSIETFTEIAPINLIKSQELTERVKRLRNRLVHSNDLLIVGSANGCDLFVTDDKQLSGKWNDKNNIIVPLSVFQEFLREVTS